MRSCRWADRTQHQRKGDFRALVRTASRGRTIKGLTKTMSIFGRHAGYFTRDQAELIDSSPGRHHLDTAPGLPAGTDPPGAVAPAR